MFVRAYPDATVQAAIDLFRDGTPVTEVAKRLGISRGTATRWKAGQIPTPRPERPTHWRPSNRAEYSYLFGIYLGDGCVSRGPRGSTFLEVTLDIRQTRIARECAIAIASLLEVRVRHYEEPRMGRRRVVASSCFWPLVFPQHGPGRKHERPIVLEAWQREVLDAHPGEFLRGLIHSDGCRTTNRFTVHLPKGGPREYAYIRYFFSNESADIRGLFCEYCDCLGIRWTQSNRRNISVAHRQSVALLDNFVGPKG
jgi:hypothetical protein